MTDEPTDSSPDGPSPDDEGAAQMPLTPLVPNAGGSIADAFGSALTLRSGEDILAQVNNDREEWS